MRTTGRDRSRRRSSALIGVVAIGGVLAAACNVKPNDYDGDKKADVVYIAGGTSAAPGCRTAWPPRCGRGCGPTRRRRRLRQRRQVGAGRAGRAATGTRRKLPHRSTTTPSACRPRRRTGRPAPERHAAIFPCRPTTTATATPTPPTTPGRRHLVDQRPRRLHPVRHAAEPHRCPRLGRPGAGRLRRRPEGRPRGVPPHRPQLPHPALEDRDRAVVAFPEHGASMPVPADYNGDNITDPAVSDIARPAWWLTPGSTDPDLRVHLSGLRHGRRLSGRADYDGDKKADPAVYDYSPPAVTAASAAWTPPWPRCRERRAHARAPLRRARQHRPAHLLQQVPDRASSRPPRVPSPRWNICPPRPIDYDFDGDRKADVAWVDHGRPWNRLGEPTPFFTGRSDQLAGIRPLRRPRPWVPASADAPAAGRRLDHSRPGRLSPARRHDRPTFPDWIGDGAGSKVVPVAGDYVGSDHPDPTPAVLREATGHWYSLDSLRSAVHLRDRPVGHGGPRTGTPRPRATTSGGGTSSASSRYRPSDSTFRSDGTGRSSRWPARRPAGAADYDGDGHDGRRHLPALDRRVVHRRPADPLAGPGGRPRPRTGCRSGRLRRRRQGRPGPVQHGRPSLGHRRPGWSPPARRRPARRLPELYLERLPTASVRPLHARPDLGHPLPGPLRRHPVGTRPTSPDAPPRGGSPCAPQPPPRRPLRLVALTTVMALALTGCFVRPHDYDGDKTADVVYIVATGPTPGLGPGRGVHPLWAGCAPT